MSHINKSFRCLLATVILAIPISASVSAEHRTRVFNYTAFFICGSNPTSTPRLISGEYRTTVAARNRDRRAADVSVEIALTFPPGGPNPGGIFQLYSVQLESGQAVSLDCDVLRPAEIAEGTPPYVEGFVTLTSERRMNVTVSQTTADASGTVSSISQLRIPARR